MKEGNAKKATADDKVCRESRNRRETQKETSDAGIETGRKRWNERNGEQRVNLEEERRKIFG